MLKITGTSLDSVGKMIGEWFSVKTDLNVSGAYSAIGWVKDGKIVAAALFNDYTKFSIEVHFFGPGFLNRKTIGDIMKYVFLQIGCSTLIAKVDRKGDEFKEFVSRIGFKYLCVIPKYFGTTKDKDAIMFYASQDMVKRWIK